MRRGVLYLSLALSAACGSKEPVPAAAPASTASPANSDEPTRGLTNAECESLAQWIVDACHERANLDRSTEAEGWCSDVERRSTAEDRSWIADCTKHIKYIDRACFRSTTKVRSFMACDSTVSRD
jgi:hypothetical protein